MTTYRVIFDGFETPEQARAFASWYEGQGEQESGIWLEESSDIKNANVETITIKGKDTIVQLKLYK